jgi:predicted HTH transcriptional regulator
MKSIAIEKLIKLPETDELEFKTQVPDIELLAKYISAFANTKGGKLIIGVQEGRGAIGVKDVNRAKRVIQKALGIISPSISVGLQDILIDGKTLIILTIPKGNLFPYLANGWALERVGDRLRPISSDTLFSHVTEMISSTSNINEELHRLTGVIEQLNAETIRLSNWKAKLGDWILGGLIGAGISGLIAYFISLT